ncbi:TetR family transcriptional regulator [Pleomorphomonas diazotrophica]|uniref:TetR family transcriptional regulator n=1 Tax=Pleomorphomonas diazotrophica TaxID=1166257 RepID=A0A1I4W7U4_9HYPH|nr:TetR/AcrR family transcriptional regulator [Pleomorphomonas diazotrophica]PKR87932.1 TetR family transcriptional regulator [Pleomorphomonas diazotrophica]SFN09457.1 DNA-binding transcriptional regulator, AcrR family [Pleomorphomonas diazotrophica]
MRKKTSSEQTAAPVEAGQAAPVTDDRVRRSKAAVLAVTADLLFERGYSGVSVDEIARRSGVAKTTIYRHWPNRADLLRDACAHVGTPLTTPDLGSLRGDLTALMADFSQMLTTARWTSVLPSIIDAGERDAEMAEMYRRLQQGYSAPFETVIRRGMARGELPAETDVPALVAALTGPLFYRRWFSREPLTEGFVREIIRIALG